MNAANYLLCVMAPGMPVTEQVRVFLDKVATNTGIVRLMDEPELMVLGDPSAAQVVMPQRCGLVWGNLFSRDLYSSVTVEDAEKLITRPMNEIIRDFWGGYLLVRCRDEAVEVLRDPSGTIPCYHCCIDGAHLFTSRPALFFDLGLISPDIDWTIVAQSLAFRDIRPARTALRHVDELLPGMCAEIGARGIRTYCAWTPWTFAEPAGQITSFEQAVMEVRDTVSGVLRAWAGAFERPLLEVSGGLDSAIVAAGISSANRSAQCATFGPGAGDANELPWARIVASQLGLPLVELIGKAATVDVRYSAARDLPRPCSRALSQAFDEPLQQLANEAACDAFIGGGGGDSVFGYSHSALPLVDRYRAEGLGRGLIATASDIATMTRTHLWRVMGAATRRSLRPFSDMPVPAANPFLSGHISPNLPWPGDNFWLRAPASIPPAKRRHVWSIIAIANHLEGYGREQVAPYLAPLMAQPILEICIAIPTWMWSRGGNNRAVAREAFRPLLPAAVVDRRTKVSFNGLVYRVVEANREILRNMLLGGILAREKLVDPTRVAAFLDSGFYRDAPLPEFMALAETEAWLAAWEGRSIRPA